MRKHLSELAMEAYLLDAERSSVSEHLGSCDACKARLARMEKEGEDFRRFVLPATLDKVVEANSRRRFSLNGWMMAVPAMAAAAALAILVLPKPPGEPPEDYIGVKGGLGLVVYTTSDKGATTIQDGGKVNPSAALRFKVRPGNLKSCNLWLVSIDEAGQVSRVYPTQGAEGAHIAQSTPLPGGAVLDGKTGLERLYAVCSPEPIAYGQVESAVRASISSGSIRKATQLAGLPKGAAQTTVLLDKKP